MRKIIAPSINQMRFIDIEDLFKRNISRISMEFFHTFFMLLKFENHLLLEFPNRGILLFSSDKKIKSRFDGKENIDFAMSKKSIFTMLSVKNVEDFEIMKLIDANELFRKEKQHVNFFNEKFFNSNSANPKANYSINMIIIKESGAYFLETEINYFENDKAELSGRLDDYLEADQTNQGYFDYISQKNTETKLGVFSVDETGNYSYSIDNNKIKESMLSAFETLEEEIEVFVHRGFSSLKIYLLTISIYGSEKNVKIFLKSFEEMKSSAESIDGIFTNKETSL